MMTKLIFEKTKEHTSGINLTEETIDFNFWRKHTS